MVWDRVRESVRELVLLEKARQKSAALTDAQRGAMRTYSNAARSRLTVARDVRGTSQAPVALELYRQGSFFCTLAYLAARDSALELDSLSPEAAYRMLDQALETNGARPPDELARARPFLVSTDPLGADRLTGDESEQRAHDLEITTHWLSTLYDLRSPRELRMARIVRISLLAASALALLVWFFAWALAPKNLARGRPTAISGTAMFSTVPAAVVDGSKSGDYGYHSALEDSPWLSVDLGEPFVITKVKVYGRGDGHYDQSIPLALEVSDDGTNYRKIDQRAEPFSASDPWVVRPTDVVARFVRVHTQRQSYLVLGEVEVNGHKPK